MQPEDIIDITDPEYFIMQDKLESEELDRLVSEENFKLEAEILQDIQDKL